MIKPQLCRDAPKAFDDPNFIWETKYDGVRILAKTVGQSHHLQARSGSEKTSLYPELEIRTRVDAILDGEIVCHGENGKTIFNDIQHRANRTKDIKWAAEKYPASYQVFDILEAKDVDLRHTPLEKRKQLLQQILIPSHNVLVAPFTEKGVALFELAKQEQLEGVIGKDKRKHYFEGKRDWFKVKVWRFDPFLVVGYTKGTGWREVSFGSLVLSSLKGNYVGSVGTGFNDEDIDRIVAMFQPAPCPFARTPEPASWVRPFMVKIRYQEYTNDGMLRIPSFKGFVK